MEKSIKQKFISSAALLLVSTIIVKIIGAVYKIPLTAYIGSLGRGYFSIAYNLCMPIHAITMGAFPVALSKLVSSAIAKGDGNTVAALKKSANRLFRIVGFIGMTLMILLALPYAKFISSSPKSIYTILVLAPSVLFSAMAASRRGFAEGNMNMVPTAVSQVLESLFKMIFGLLFARLVMTLLYNDYITYGRIFEIVPENDAEALAFIYPLTSAAAMGGVTLGSIASYLYVSVYVKLRYPDRCKNLSLIRSNTKELLSFSAPLLLMTAVSSLSVFLETVGVQYGLSICDEAELKKIYESGIALSSTAGEDVVTYVFGVYSSALDFKNLVPGITMALGVAAVPAISSAYEFGSERLSSLLTSIFKYTVAISAGGGIFLSLFSEEILSLFYASSNPDLVTGCKQILYYSGFTMLFVCLASVAVFSVQSLGYSSSSIPSFIVSAAVRFVLNIWLVQIPEINVLGGVISSFVGYTIIMVWNILIILRKTHGNISFSQVFFKPVFCCIVTFVAIDYAKEKLTVNSGFLSNFILEGAICLIIYIVMLFITETIRLSDIKSFTKM